MTSPVPEANEAARLPKFVPVETLRDLPVGSAVLTHGVVWVKRAPEAWICPTSDKGYRDCEWMARVAVRVLFDVAEWEREQGYRR